VEEPGPSTRTLSHDSDNDPGREPLGPADLAPGVGVDRYVILERVGQGGMGVVYAAYDPRLDRRVALKFLHWTDEDHDGRHEKRLLREAQAMARLSHPNVAVVYEVGRFQRKVFLAMEFVDGVDLRTWLAARKRLPREILDVLAAAGRGLAAAHAAGIIHRDFKPENVLVDKQERPRVTDFGLSRAAPEPGEDVDASTEAAAIGPGGRLWSPLTRTGGVLGTPRYMSPEQHLGGATDERSDQFSFCLALYEALYGEPPFRGESREEMLDSVLGGKMSPAPAPSTVPRGWRQAIVRGLDPAPDRRFPSMDALLAALSRDPRRRRRQIVAGAVLGLGLVALGAGYAQLRELEAGAPGPRCDLGASRLAGAWDEPSRHRARDAFQRAGVPGVDAAWRSFAAVLDRRAGAWAAMHDQACAATHIDGVQSASVLDLRMECLDRKRQEMKALVEVYSDRPDAKMIDRATSAADNLSLISACADVANLRARVPLPESREGRATVASLRQRLSRARALHEAGRFEQEREQLASLVPEADATGYAPVAAEATSMLGAALSTTAKEKEAEALLYEAANLAVKGRDWTLEAETWVSIISNYGRQGLVHEGLVAARAAELALTRAHADDALRARLMTETGWMEYRANRYREALPRFEAAEKLWSTSLGTGSSQYAGTLQRIGTTLGTLGRIREAVAYLERALAVRRAILRPDHVDIAGALIGLGQAYSYLGRYAEERDAFRAAHEIFRKELGRDHPMTRSTQLTLASAEADLGDHTRALEMYESASPAAVDPRDISGGLGLIVHADIQFGAGHHGEAEKSLHRALRHYAGAGFPDHVNTGYARTGLGMVHNRRRQFRRGVLECRRALSILTREMDPASHLLSETRACIGDGLIGMRDFAAARKELELALSSAREGECAPLMIATLRFHLARALWPAKRDRARAVELARSALSTLEAAEGDTRELGARVAAWLAPRAPRTARR
jgi:tetratricopeptide (TPR) repeat protein